ncbi:Remorin, C-terminal [Artemisia annua]|uniref:Remorin, C-terminal n=1 Tax=Artemisia annua TaxID=35608 RepID=A0A2U1PGI6_ARTAN|nr:Remorin, C-terminal [Artemisia annua]
MDLKSSNYLLHSNSLEEKSNNLYEDGFGDSLSKLKLKETSTSTSTTDFVKLFPMAKTNVAVEAPPTPGRPIFSFSVGSRKNIPSKWDDAQKWLISGPDSPAHHHNLVSKHSSNGSHGHVVKPQQLEHHGKTTTEEEKVCKAISVIQVPTNVPLNQNQDSSDVVLLKDKFTNEEQNNISRFKCLVPIKQGFLFTSMKDASTEVVHEVKKIDMGTNTTPHGSSNALQCPTLFQSVSPPRHNTPASMSGPLALMNSGSSFDIAELQECHFAKLQLEPPFNSVDNACNWSSREEEEEDVSKSLRHFEMNNECPKSVLEPKVCAWQEEEKTKSQLRYQREEAKIEAWVNLQKAKAEAQSRKLEVKIQKMRFKFEEKMMKSMAKVHRKAEELRAAAQYEHNMELRKATLPSKKTKDLRESMHFSGRVGSCGCFPCNSTL